MQTTAEREMQHIGESKGAENHDHDIVHELSKRLDTVWRLDQYIANAEGNSSLENFWTKLKQQEQENVKQLKKFVKEEVQKDCF
jgi:hypothetical protein